MPYYQLGIWTRNEFGVLLRDLGLVGNAVEVGTHRAAFAKELLSRWPGVLHCVDPWCNPPGYEYQSKLLEHSAGDRLLDAKEAVRVLYEFGGRGVMHFLYSQGAMEHFQSGTLDFVYIDGDHRQEMVRADLWGWWPKLKPGGIIAGHDWLCPGEKDHGWGKGIQPEVAAFADYHNIDTVYLIPGPDQLPWSFYMQKPGGKFTL